jgi:hypothetical protein
MLAPIEVVSWLRGALYPSFGKPMYIISYLSVSAFWIFGNGQTVLGCLN